MCTDLGKWSRCKGWEAQDRNKISNFPKPLRDLEYQEQEAHAPKYKRRPVQWYIHPTPPTMRASWEPQCAMARSVISTSIANTVSCGGQISWKCQRRSQFSSVSSTFLPQLFTSLPAERSTDPREYTLQWPASAGLHPVVTGANR